MNTKRVKCQSKLILELTSYGNYIGEARRLEGILARKPARLLIDLVGIGEIPPDSALLMRSIILGRSARTRIITNARSSLQGAAVLIWLLGDTRQIREDARVRFRAAGPFVTSQSPAPAWKDRRRFDDDDEGEEEDYIRVLHAINQFLPVKELADQQVDLTVLKQFGLVANEKVDRFLASAFQKRKPPQDKQWSTRKRKLIKEASR